MGVDIERPTAPHVVGLVDSGARASSLHEARLGSKLVEDRRERALSGLAGRDRSATLLIGCGFLAVAVAMAVLIPVSGSASLGLAALYVAVYAVASQIEFEVGPGSAVPTQLVLVPMLFALPPSRVPLCVAAGLVLGGVIDHARRRIHRDHLLLMLVSSWHAVGPALVLALAATGEPTWSECPIYLAALAAQFALDAASSAARDCLGLGIRVRTLLGSLSWVFLVDALLAPIGFLAALASADSPLAFLVVLSLVGVLRLFAVDRREHIDQSLAFAKEARLDHLTGLGNRLAWEEALVEAEARVASSGESVSVLLLDLDGLKIANDTRGHDFGDRLIRALAGAIHESFRVTDVVARIGGDEFAVLLEHVDAAECQERARALAAAIAGHPGLGGFPLSASIGFGSCPPAETLAEAVKGADATLYEEKHRSARTRQWRAGPR